MCYRAWIWFITRSQCTINHQSWICLGWFSIDILVSLCNVIKKTTSRTHSSATIYRLRPPWAIWLPWLFTFSSGIRVYRDTLYSRIYFIDQCSKFRLKPIDFGHFGLVSARTEIETLQKPGNSPVSVSFWAFRSIFAQILVVSSRFLPVLLCLSLFWPKLGRNSPLSFCTALCLL